MHTTLNSNALKRINFTDLVRVTAIDPAMLRSIVKSPAFPAHVGREPDRQLVWHVAAVANYFDRIHYPADAEAIRAWADGQDND